MGNCDCCLTEKCTFSLSHAAEERDCVCCCMCSLILVANFGTYNELLAKTNRRIIMLFTYCTTKVDKVFLHHSQECICICGSMHPSPVLCLDYTDQYHIKNIVLTHFGVGSLVCNALHMWMHYPRCILLSDTVRGMGEKQKKVPNMVFKILGRQGTQWKSINNKYVISKFVSFTAVSKRNVLICLVKCGNFALK